MNAPRFDVSILVASSEGEPVQLSLGIVEEGVDAGRAVDLLDDLVERLVVMGGVAAAPGTKPAPKRTPKAKPAPATFDEVDEELEPERKEAPVDRLAVIRQRATNGTVQRCSVCGEAGHNRRSCSEAA